MSTCPFPDVFYMKARSFLWPWSTIFISCYVYGVSNQHESESNNGTLLAMSCPFFSAMVLYRHQSQRSSLRAHRPRNNVDVSSSKNTEDLYKRNFPTSALLVWVARLIALAHPDLALLLVHHVLDPDLLRVLLLEVADIARIPKLGSDAQVLAAAHQCVALAPFASGGDAVVVTEELALASCLSDKSEVGGTTISI